jgi:WD40 repeat protein
MSLAPPALESIAATQFGDYVAGLAWHPSGTMLAVGCADGVVHEMAAEGGASAPVLSHDGGVCAVAYSGDGVLASAGEDARVAIAPLPPQMAGAGWVELLAWAPDGSRLATAVGHRVQIWTSAGAMVAESAHLSFTVESLAWTPGGARLAVGGHGGVVFLGPDAAPSGAALEWQGVTLSLAWASDGRRLACGMQDNTVWIWDVVAGQAATLGGHARKVRELAWSGDGRWLVSGGGTMPVAWRFEGMEPLPVSASDQIELQGHEKAVVWAGFQPGGALLATAAEDGLGVVWMLPAERPLTGATIGEPVSAAAWSPDGARLALGGETGRVAVFDLV